MCGEQSAGTQIANKCFVPFGEVPWQAGICPPPAAVQWKITSCFSGDDLHPRAAHSAPTGAFLHLESSMTEFLHHFGVVGLFNST